MVCFLIYNVCPLYSGYMAPEYVIDGLFSVRSDVFSFGVLVLELISGRKNKEFYHPTSPNLIGHASIKCNISTSSIVARPIIDEEILECFRHGDYGMKAGIQNLWIHV